MRPGSRLADNRASDRTSDKTCDKWAFQRGVTRIAGSVIPNKAVSVGFSAFVLGFKHDPKCSSRLSEY